MFDCQTSANRNKSASQASVNLSRPWFLLSLAQSESVWAGPAGVAEFAAVHADSSATQHPNPYVRTLRLGVAEFEAIFDSKLLTRGVL